MVGVPSFVFLVVSLFPLCGDGCSLGIECHIPPHTWPLFCFLSFGCTDRDLRVLIGLWYTGMS